MSSGPLTQAAVDRINGDAREAKESRKRDSRDCTLGVGEDVEVNGALFEVAAIEGDRVHVIVHAPASNADADVLPRPECPHHGRCNLHSTHRRPGGRIRRYWECVEPDCAFKTSTTDDESVKYAAVSHGRPTGVYNQQPPDIDTAQDMQPWRLAHSTER